MRMGEWKRKKKEKEIQIRSVDCFFLCHPGTRQRETTGGHVSQTDALSEISFARFGSPDSNRDTGFAPKPKRHYCMCLGQRLDVLCPYGGRVLVGAPSESLIWALSMAPQENCCLSNDPWPSGDHQWLAIKKQKWDASPQCCRGPHPFFVLIPSSHGSLSLLCNL